MITIPTKIRYTEEIFYKSDGEFFSNLRINEEAKKIWQTDDRQAHRRLNVPYPTFASNLDGLFEKNSVDQHVELKFFHSFRSNSIINSPTHI